MQVTNRLAALRDAAGLGREELAETLGVDLSTVSRWETGRHTIPDARKLELTRLLSGLLKRPITVSALMGWPEDDGNGKEAA